MGNVLTFTPRTNTAAPTEPVLMAEADIRTRLGEALQTALDAADHIIAVLDGMVGDIDQEDGVGTEPALAASESQHDGQVVWLRNNDSGQEAEAPEVVAAGRAVIPFASPPWGSAGNVVADAGITLLDMVAGGGR